MTEPRRRKNLRLHNHDYSSNCVYHVIIGTNKNIPWLSRIGVKATIQLTPHGQAVEASIQKIPVIYRFIRIKNHVIMPNYVHLLLHFKFPDTEEKKPTLSNVIGQMKRHASMQAKTPLWQRSFYDNVISDRTEYDSAMRYIDENPANWPNDEYYVNDPAQP